MEDKDLDWLFKTNNTVCRCTDIEEDLEWESIDDPEWIRILEDEGKDLTPDQVQEVLRLLS